MPVFESSTHKNIGALIPLCENEHFKTIFFEHMINDDVFNLNYLEQLTCSSNSELPGEFMELMDHHPPEEYDRIKKLKLTQVIDWKVGRVFSWPRNQLHCSSNFEKYNLTKQAIVLWL